MKFCQDHWDGLRTRIHSAGLSTLVAEDGETVAKQMMDAMERGSTIDNYDPLMDAHWTIAANAMEFLNSVGISPLILMQPMEEFPDGENECPICCLNLLSYDHDLHCPDPFCMKPKGQTFDEWLDKAVGGQVEKWKELGGTT